MGMAHVSPRICPTTYHRFFTLVLGGYFVRTNVLEIDSALGVCVHALDSALLSFFDQWDELGRTVPRYIGDLRAPSFFNLGKFVGLWQKLSASAFADGALTAAALVILRSVLGDWHTGGNVYPDR